MSAINIEKAAILEAILDDVIKENFWKRVSQSETCWMWTGLVNNKGYGLLGLCRNALRGGVLAHRLSWLIHNGPIPIGSLVLHRCDVRGCVNPQHLFLGTYSDNVKDMMSKGRGKKPMNKSHCINGHEFTEANSGRHSNGRRICLECNRRHSREFQERRRRAMGMKPRVMLKGGVPSWR